MRSQRPAHGVDDFAGADAAGRNFPEFFYADAIGLRVGVFGEIKFLNQLLGERSAWAFGENDDLGLQIVAGVEVGFLVSLFVDTFVVSANAGDAVALEKQFRSGESGEDRDAGFFDLASEPLHELIQRDDVVAMVAEERRCDGKLEFRFFGEEVDAFLDHLRVERRFFFKVGQQFRNRTGIEQGSGEAVLSDLAGFLEDVDIFFAELCVGMRRVVRVDKLCQAQRAGHPGGTAADDDDIGGHLRTFNTFDRFAEKEHMKKSATDYADHHR